MSVYMLALVVQHAIRIFGLSGCSILFPRYLINGMIFDQKNVIEHKTCVLISSTSFATNISHSTKNSARYYKFPHVFMQSTRHFRILITLVFSLPIFIKASSFKFHKNASSGSRVFPCRPTEGRTDTTKPIVSSCNFANAPKIFYILPTQYIRVVYGSKEKNMHFFLYSTN